MAGYYKMASAQKEKVRGEDASAQGGSTPDRSIQKGDSSKRYGPKRYGAKRYGASQQAGDEGKERHRSRYGRSQRRGGDAGYKGGQEQGFPGMFPSRFGYGGVGQLPGAGGYTSAEQLPSLGYSPGAPGGPSGFSALGAQTGGAPQGLSPVAPGPYAPAPEAPTQYAPTPYAPTQYAPSPGMPYGETAETMAAPEMRETPGVVGDYEEGGPDYMARLRRSVDRFPWDRLGH